MSKDLPTKPLSFWQRITKAFAKPVEKPERPAHGADWARAQGAANPYPVRFSMGAFASHGYVFAAVSRASQDLAALPIKLIRGKGENSEILEEHPFLDLMEQPSTYKDGFSFREQLVVDLMLSGGCYVLLAGTTDVPTSLFRLHPEQTKIVTDPVMGIKAFEFTDSGTSVEYSIDRVVYAQSASWGTGVDSLYGLGGVQPLQREISADISAQKLASDAAKKGRPDILISPADEADIWDYEQRRAILDAYKGMSSEGGAMVLSGQVKIEPLQVTPRDLEFQAVRDYTRQAISAVFGVPPSILGDNSANFAVARQQAKTYWDVQTKRGKRLSFLLTQIAKRFDPSLRVEVDYSGVEALQEVRDAQLDRATKHILNGLDAAEAYAYEGMQDAPIIPDEDRESPAEDVGDEEGQNVRAMEMILRAISRDEKQETNYGLKSNAKEAMSALSEATQKGLKKKAKDHNEDYGDNPKKRLTNSNYLAVSYWRGLAAFETNPESVRPSVNSPQQWAMGRVNGLLYALRTGKYRRRPYDTDLLPKDHPLSGSEEKAKENTNFPTRGDNRAVSLDNSQYRIFDAKYAKDLKDNWPSIWRKGGNIEGNNQYRRLAPIVGRENTEPKTETEEMAIRKREAWAARHLQDFRLAGTVAQIKWFVVGEKGQTYMKDLIEEEKRKIEGKKERAIMWDSWLQKKQGPAERAIERAMIAYLREAKKRYVKRARAYIRPRKGYTPEERKSVTDWSALLAIVEEVKILQKQLGRHWLSVWALAGDDALDEVYASARKTRPLDLVFGSREAAVEESDFTSLNIAQTTAKRLKTIFEDGLLRGDSVADIAKEIEDAKIFNTKRARMIARTESTKAINLATTQAYNAAQVDGINIRKQWLSANDSLVRDTHKELNGKIVGVNEMFVVPSNGNKGLSPANFGEAEEDINCRCTIAPVIDE